MQESSSCLGEDALLLLASGALSGEEREQAEAHIDGCRACRMLVGVAANSSEVAHAYAGAEDLGVFKPEDLVGGRYQITRLLGRGGMGEVYEALDTSLAEKVALKTIGVETPLDTQGIARLKAEVQLARRVTHPNVCRVFDLGFHRTSTLRAGGEPLTIPFLTMEMLDGETLRASIDRRQRIEPKEALDILAQMASGLEAAHAAGIAHADLKADNVILVGGGTAWFRAVITDFGLARRYRAGALSTKSQGLVGGTIGYMAPECLDGRRPGPAGDIYALGVVLFEMLTGARPYAGPSPLAVAMASVKGPPPSLRTRAQVPEWWDDVVRRCLDANPERRFARASQLIAALRPAVVPSRGRWRSLAMAGALLAAVGGAALALRRPDPPTARPPEAPPVVRAPVPTAPLRATLAPPALYGPPAPPPEPGSEVRKASALRRPARSIASAARPTAAVAPRPVPSAPASAVKEPGDDDAIDPF